MEWETIETTGNLSAQMAIDDDPMSPREWDNLGTMACWHSRYKLGDEQPKQEYSEWLESMIDDPDSIQDWYDRELDRLCDKYQGSADAPYWNNKQYQDAVEQLDKERSNRIRVSFEREYVALPLYLYDHSGITMSTGAFSCPWDSGQVGIVYVSKCKALKEWGRKRWTKDLQDKVIACLEREVSTYDQFLRGEVYGYRIVEEESGEKLDSCWGFFGREYAEEEARSALTHAADQAKEQGTFLAEPVGAD